MLKISLLIDCPQHLPLVASWIFEEWGRLIPGLTLEKVKSQLKNHLNRDAIPLTFVACSDEIPVGTASLMLEDMSSRPNLSPWLASVYVLPGYRKQGIGSQLVRVAEGMANKLEIQNLYLFTPDRRFFYEHLGWIVIEVTEYRGQQVVVMRKSF